MNKKSLLVCVFVGIAGFFLGKVAGTLDFKMEKQFNTFLNQSDIIGLGRIQGTIHVTGHKNPDSDSVGSSIAYAALLRKLAFDAVPVVLDPINNESAYILKAAGLETPKLLEDASGLNMVLVDHSEYSQSAEGMKNANIITIIDHHGDGSVQTSDPLIYDARPLGSTATIIWLRYLNYGIEPDKQSAIVMMGAILSDTQNLKSETTTLADHAAVSALSKLSGISDIDAFYQGMSKAQLSDEGKTGED